MLPELVVFDMAGTTVYDGDAVHTCLGNSLKSGGIDATRDDINEVMGLPKPMAIRMLMQKSTGVMPSEDTVADLHTRFLSSMLSYYSTDPAVREIEGATETFAALHSAGIKVGLDTGFSRDIADTIIARLGWNAPGVLDVTVTSDEVANGRPYPDLIYRAMEITGIGCATAIAKVGDTPSDLQEGSSAGCGWVIGVTQGSHTEQQLKPNSHTHLIGTIAELPALLGI